MDEQLQKVRRCFKSIYLDGIPHLAPNPTAFLGFICVLTAIEALAGYRYPRTKGAGKRFEQFVTVYFDPFTASTPQTCGTSERA